MKSALKAAIIVACVSLGPILGPSAGAADQAASHNHIISCNDSPTPGVRPPQMECAIVVRKQIDSLPRNPIVWRYETFGSIAAARQAEGWRSLIVSAGGKIWLLTLGTKGERSRGGAFVTEIGPLIIAPTRRYEILGGEVYTSPGESSRVHTHPGPEAWYLLQGAQCLETPNRVLRARAGEATFAPAATPMKLTVVGTTKRDAVFTVVHDAALPWSAGANWHPKGRCTGK